MRPIPETSIASWEDDCDGLIKEVEKMVALDAFFIFWNDKINVEKLLERFIDDNYKGYFARDYLCNMG